MFRKMIFSTFMLIVLLTGAACAISASSSLLRTGKHPFDLRCQLVVGMEAKVLTKTKITVVLAKDEYITQEFFGNSRVDGVIVCIFNDETFNLVRFFANEDKITCSCLNQVCSPQDAAIEKKLENNTWKPLSSWTTTYNESFQVSAFKTTNTEVPYRCVLPFDDKFITNEEDPFDMDDAIVVLCCCFLVFVLLSQIFVLLMLTEPVQSTHRN